MTKTNSFIFGFGTIVVCIILLIFIFFNQNKDNHDWAYVLSKNQYEAMLYMNLLEAIKSGHTNIAIEILDDNLEQNVFRLNAIAEQRGQKLARQANEFLEWIVIFRKQYPKESDKGEPLRQDQAILNISDNKNQKNNGDVIVIETICLDNDSEYLELRFLCDKFILLHDWDLAKKNLQAIMNIVNNVTDERYIKALQQLNEINKRTNSGQDNGGNPQNSKR